MAFLRNSRFITSLVASWLTLVVLSVFPQVATAASFNYEAETITLTGEIAKGDLAKLTEIVFSQPQLNGGWTLSLNSDGGDFDEGLKIAAFVNANHLATRVKANNKCNSACALVFLGGSAGSEGNSGPSRSLEVGAALGFHAPYNQNLQNPSPAIISQGLARLDAQLTVLGVPPAIRPFLTVNDDQRSLYDATTVEAIELLEIAVEDAVYQPSKITKSMALNSCINGYLYGKSQLPSKTRGSSLQDYQQISAVSPHKLFNSERDGAYAVIPALYLEPGVIGDCKILSGGVCVGVFTHGLSATELAEEAFTEECQRNNLDTVLVPANTRLVDLASTLQRMENEEPALLSGIEDIADGDSAEPTPKQIENAQVAVAVQRGVICNQTQGFANVRSGPNASQFGLVATLQNQKPVEVLNASVPNPVTGHLWKQIRWDSSQGFVDGDLVQPTCLVAMAPKPVVIPKPPAFNEFEVQVCNAGGDSANMRSGPNPTIDGIVQNIVNFETLKVVGETRNPVSGQRWYKVRFGGIDGYVDSELVSAACNLSAPSPVDTSFSGEPGVICNSNGVITNMREGPNAQQFDIVRSLVNFVDIRVLEKTSNPISGHPWLKISVDGVTGFVDADSVKSECE